MLPGRNINVRSRDSAKIPTSCEKKTEQENGRRDPGQGPYMALKVTPAWPTHTHP